MSTRPVIAALLVAVGVGFASCKSQFEKVRTSGDTEEILAAADAYYAEGKYDKAQTLYQIVVTSLRADPRVQGVLYRYADTYFQNRDYFSAAAYFRNYAENYKAADNREEALYMEALSYVKQSPDFRLEQSNTDKAIEALETFVTLYPETERLTEINNTLDELRVKQETKAYDAARLYFDMKQYQAAVQAFERVLQDYPDTDRAEEIRWRIVEAYVRLADNSVIAKRRERYELALDAAEVYLKKYPAGEYARQTTLERDRIRELLKTTTDYVGY